MTQFNFGTIVASTKSGSGLAADLNAWRDALHTGHKGPARPTYKVAGLSWINDAAAPWVDYVYDGVGDALRGFIDPSTHRYSTAGNFAKTITSGGVTARLADWGTLFNLSGSAAQTVAIDPKSSLLAGWWIRVIAQNIAVTINPFGAETVDGLAQIILPSGSSITVFYDGTNFWTDANGGGASAFPVGGVVYVPASAPPAGFLRMNGALISRETYAGLWGFAQASSNITPTDAEWLEGRFSPGDGATTFRLPDARGNFIRPWDNARGVDPSRALGTLQASALATHGHTGWTGGGGYHNHSAYGGTDAQGNHQHLIGGDFRGSGVSSNGGYLVNGGTNVGTSWAGTHQHNVSGGYTSIVDHHTHAVGISDYAGAAETRPRNIALLACIKY